VSSTTLESVQKKPLQSELAALWAATPIWSAEYRIVNYETSTTLIEKKVPR